MNFEQCNFENCEEALRIFYLSRASDVGKSPTSRSTFEALFQNSETARVPPPPSTPLSLSFAVPSLVYLAETESATKVLLTFK